LQGACNFLRRNPAPTADTGHQPGTFETKRLAGGKFIGQGLRRLIEAYAQGQSCEEAPRSALGKPLSRLERAWLASLGVTADWSWLGDVAPWLALLGLVLAPLGVMALLAGRETETLPEEAG